MTTTPTPTDYRQELIDLHGDLTEKALGIMKVKNSDYGADHDPFRNFRGFGAFGILVRLSDKLARIRTFLERGDLKVKDESVRDSIVDAINYLVILYGYISFGDKCRDDDVVRR